MVFKKIFSKRVFAAIAGGFAMLLAWDALWCAATTFRGMSFVATYAWALLLAWVLALPTLLCRRAWVQLAVWLVMAGLMEANLMYCRTYLTWIPLESYLLASNLGDFTASVADSLRWTDCLPTLVVIAAWLWLRRKEWQPAGKAYCIGLAVAAVVASATALANGGMPKHVEALRNECYYSTTPPIIYTLPGAMASEAWLRESTLSEADFAAAKDWIDEQQRRCLAYPIADRPGRDNLVVIFCESLESWLIGQRADGDKEITPYLNSLVADSTTLYFPHVRSQVGNGRSIDAQLLMLAGMYPLEQKVYSMKYPQHTYYSIAQAMKRRCPDAATLLLTCDKPITWNQQLVAEAFGVDSIISRDNWEMTELVGNPAKLSDGAFMQQATAKLENGEFWAAGTTAYLHFVTYSGHNPFRLPDHLKRIRIEGDYPEKMTDYMTMANYTDHSLRPLIDYLRSRPDWDKTMVAIVGDHEALGSYRKEWLQNAEAAKILSPETEVPLIVLNSPVAGCYEEPVGQVDVYSTLIDLMGLRPYAWMGMGQSAFDPQRQPFGSKEEHAAQGPEQSQTIITYDLLPQLAPMP